ncbi:MAG TPA: ACP synthase [Candidatus Cloacimonas sp.]|jgi:holo-[acyl-carrier protein] synthase|nr:ACP synthase [Candidatus Cloacimonas sp.]
MIYGVGIDNIEVPRIKKQLDRSKNFKTKIFTEHEIEYCESQANYAQCFAARFAAKEAFMKALGTGWSNGVKFSEIEVVNSENGRPSLNITGASAKQMSQNQIRFSHLSISHLKDYAVAVVILEK